MYKLVQVGREYRYHTVKSICQTTVINSDHEMLIGTFTISVAKFGPA